MKWAAAALCMLGIAAALCAAFLVNSLRASTLPPTVVIKQADEPPVQVICATASIPAMSVVDAKSVAIKSLPKDQVPKDYVSSPVDVVGKVVSGPVVEGQAFTISMFADKPTARQVADAIPFGKRAVGISVTDYAGLEGMLFPGSTVDVMVSFKPQEGDWTQGVTATLLENIQVLGIEQQTVVSQNKPMVDPAYSIGHNNTRRVTLLVDTEQAKKLQLAMGYGTLSLALRNPMDGGKSNDKSLSMKSLLNDFAAMHWFDKITTAAATAPPPPPAPAPTTKPAEAPHWDVIVIRGSTQEVDSLPMPKSDTHNVEAMNNNP